MRQCAARSRAEASVRPGSLAQGLLALACLVGSVHAQAGDPRPTRRPVPPVHVAASSADPASVPPSAGATGAPTAGAPGTSRAGSALQQTGEPLHRPDVILVVLDDVGAKDIELVHTPTIHELASSGRNFTRGYSMPVCAPARRSLMFAEYSESTGPLCQDTSNFQTPHTDWFSLPKPFEALGYETAYLGKWHLGTNDLGMPWELTPQLHGFDSTFAVVPGNVGAECALFQGDYYNWLAVENGISYVETRYQTIVLRDKFMEG